MTAPTCEMSFGGPHNSNPPPAAVQAALEWKTLTGEITRRVKNLCAACYDVKMREFTEHALEGDYSLITVIQRYEETP